MRLGKAGARFTTEEVAAVAVVIYRGLYSVNESIIFCENWGEHAVCSLACSAEAELLFYSISRKAETQDMYDELGRREAESSSKLTWQIWANTYKGSPLIWRMSGGMCRLAST